MWLGKKHLFGDAAVPGRQAGGRHLEPFWFEADAGGDGGEQGHLKRMQKMMLLQVLGI